MHSFLSPGCLPGGRKPVAKLIWQAMPEPLEHIRFTKLCPIDNDKMLKNCSGAQDRFLLSRALPPMQQPP